VSNRGQADLGSLLEGVLANLDLRTRFREHLAVMGWPQIAGRAVAAHSEAEAVRDGVLIVATDSPAWAHELQMRQQELLRILADRLGPGVIRQIHFRSGLRRRRQKSSRRHGTTTRPSEYKLSGRQEKQIGEAAAKIEDEELRQRAQRAFASLARMAAWRKQHSWRRCRRCGQWQRVGRWWCSSCSYSGRRRRRR
jgi:predicted nucleic acid-binding Zn ribbon protein